MSEHSADISVQRLDSTAEPRRPSADLFGPDARDELDQIAGDLAAVELALERLDAGTYWTCEVSGEDLPDELLTSNPVVRRLPADPSTPPDQPSA